MSRSVIRDRSTPRGRDRPDRRRGRPRRPRFHSPRRSPARCGPRGTASNVVADGVAAGRSLAFTWLVYERLTPLSGALGFLLVVVGGVRRPQLHPRAGSSGASSPPATISPAPRGERGGDRADPAGRGHGRRRRQGLPLAAPALPHPGPVARRAARLRDPRRRVARDRRHARAGRHRDTRSRFRSGSRPRCS